jgi:phenylalanyl-tRNA synthetase beta chain
VKVPLSWLKEYVDWEGSAQDLADRLTFSGSEVESVETVGSDYEGIRVAEVTGIRPHPRAAGLKVCEVYDGRDLVPVVCGAENFAEGDRVVLAGVGAVLPDGRRIAEATLRGEASRGMLCAEDELGISDDHSGLVRLPAHLSAGTPFSKVAGGADRVIEIEVTPNRPDCLSIIGIAREVAALYGTRLRIPPCEIEESAPPVGDFVRIEVEDADGCPRYTARWLRGLKLGLSPLWMRLRLTRCGVRPINNLVDITNYVMLECGQPMHAFDARRLEESRIVVRRVRPGEKLATLDGVERAITPEMLVIADGRRPVALAGIMGGAGSEIGSQTDTVLLESACFKPSLIRRTAKALSLMTESSYRFERGVDIHLAEWASRRAAGLYMQHAGAEVAAGVADVFPNPPPPREIECRCERVRAMIGADIPDPEIVAILNSLDLEVVRAGGDRCRARIPAFRVDIEAEADLVEEVARVYGLDRVPAPTPRVQLVPGADDRRVRASGICRERLAALGLVEITNYSTVSDGLLDRFGCGDAARRVVIPKPVSADQNVLRESLIPQMVQTLGANRARQIAEAALFEMGRVFFKSGDGAFAEEERVAIGMMGPVGRPDLDKMRPPAEEEVFQWLRGVFEELCASLRLCRERSAGLAVSALSYAKTDVPCFQKGRAVSIAVEGRACGVMGLIGEALRKEWRLTDPVAVLEVRLDPLLGHVFEGTALKPVSAYPSVSRDIAIIVDETVRHEDVLTAVKQAASAELVNVRLFDVYRGPGIRAGKKSLAYSFTYRSLDRTLTDEEANAFHARVRDGLAHRLGAEVRDKA